MAALQLFDPFRVVSPLFCTAYPRVSPGAVECVPFGDDEPAYCPDAEPTGEAFGQQDDIELAGAAGYCRDVKTIRYVYWRDEDMWLGHLEDYPDYMTQGRTLAELRENLRDIFEDIAGGHIPGVRRVAKLQIA